MVIVFPGISPRSAIMRAIIATYLSFWSEFSLNAIFDKTIPAIVAATNAIAFPENASQNAHFCFAVSAGVARFNNNVETSLSNRATEISTKAITEAKESCLFVSETSRLTPLFSLLITNCFLAGFEVGPLP